MSIGISSSTQESNPAQAISLRYAFAGFTDIPRAGFRSPLARLSPRLSASKSWNVTRLPTAFAARTMVSMLTPTREKKYEGTGERSNSTKDLLIHV
jgi:hypothetical protein